MTPGEFLMDLTGQAVSSVFKVGGANLQDARFDFKKAKTDDHAHIRDRKDITNPKLSALMTKVGMPQDSKGVFYDSESKQSKQLWKSEEIQDFINKNIIDLLGNQNKTYDIEFKTKIIDKKEKMDNFVGLQHCKLLNLHITLDGYFDGIIVDYYDFEYRNQNGFFNRINNWGYSMQEKGFLKNIFTIYHIHEKIW